MTPLRWRPRTSSRQRRKHLRRVRPRPGGTALRRPWTSRSHDRAQPEHQKLTRLTIVGPDRVRRRRPTGDGLSVPHAQRVPSVISVGVADAPQVVERENAQVSNLSATETGVRFDYLEHALPFPLEQVAAPALALVPFEQNLDQETLTVRLKQPGTYRLLIDDKPVGDYGSEQLSTGVNLALNAATPHSQAQALHATVERRRSSGLRSFAQIRMMLLRAKIDDATRRRRRTSPTSRRPGQRCPEPVLQGQFDNYLKTGPEREQLTPRSALTTQLWEQNKPVPITSPELPGSVGSARLSRSLRASRRLSP